MKKVLLGVFGASVLLASLSFTGCSTSPKGTEGKIVLSDTLASGTKDMVTVTLKDADLTVTTEPVTVTSSVDPVGITLNLNGKNGVYSGTLAFSTTASGADIIKVINGALVTFTYKDALPAGTRTETLIWQGGALGVAVSSATYQGISTPMNITVTDTNVASATVTANIVTSTFATPLVVTLNQVAGSIGVYTGAVYFTVSNLATLQDTLRVKDGDNVTVSYSDAVVTGAATATAVWTGVPAELTTDSASYSGLTDVMNISVSNANITNPTVTVHVASAKGDTAGINVTLTARQDTPWIYTGKVGFGMVSSSAAAPIIGVKDSDVVTISYLNSVKNTTQTAQVNWYSTILPGLGIYSVDVTPASSVNSAIVPMLFNWGTTTCIFDSTDSMGINGKTPALNVVAGTVGWAGFGWCNTAAGVATGINLTAYAACTLHVALKGDATDLNLLVENNNPNGNTIPQTWVDAATFGYAPDGAWHVLNIPLSAWSATCDFTDLTYFLGVDFTPYAAGQWVTVDDVYWTLPAANGSTSKRRVLLKTKAK